MSPTAPAAEDGSRDDEVVEPIIARPSPGAYGRRLERATAADSPYPLDVPNGPEIAEAFAEIANAVGVWLRKGSALLPGGYSEARDVLRFFALNAPTPPTPEEIDADVAELHALLAALPSAKHPILPDPVDERSAA